MQKQDKQRWQNFISYVVHPKLVVSYAVAILKALEPKVITS